CARGVQWVQLPPDYW
nr:immunoglobulin heavy chain junction region [Macaca mulatta]MOX37819.1 immunoglobulin heavy chain junction region [Macaca mulatta]MOX37863.1 immunoglobulin heavy chain junction region [Macaca mulatta]MOX38347.1 immunoglobulin heavy chain junction region [Macaca mulatta]MOX38605.1 immunoglobulin heavy chain junction region [Macaca mulatta]